MKQTTTAILLAAGNSARMGYNKLLMDLTGHTPLELSLRAIVDAGIKRLAITVNNTTLSYVKQLKERMRDVEINPVSGGNTRAISVFNALKKCDSCDVVVIHDAARCLVTPDIIAKSVELAKEHGSAIAMTIARDTIRSIKTHRAIRREEHALIQTPQTFVYEQILKAYTEAFNKSIDGVIEDQDDCAVYERLGLTPHYFEAGILNQKLTFPSDVPLFCAALNQRR